MESVVAQPLAVCSCTTCSSQGCLGITCEVVPVCKTCALRANADGKAVDAMVTVVT